MINKQLRDAIWAANHIWEIKRQEIRLRSTYGSEGARQCLEAALEEFKRSLTGYDMEVGPRLSQNEKNTIIHTLKWYLYKSDDSSMPNKTDPIKKLLLKISIGWDDADYEESNPHQHEAQEASHEAPDMTWPPITSQGDKAAPRRLKSYLVVPGSLDTNSNCSHRSVVRIESFGPGEVINVPEELGGGRAVVGPDATSEIAHCVCGQLIWSASALNGDAERPGDPLVMFVDE